MNLTFNAHTYQFGLFSSSIILLAFAFSFVVVISPPILRVWRLQAFKYRGSGNVGKSRHIPLAPTHSEVSAICLNTLKGRQNNTSAHLSLPRLSQFGISRSIAAGRLMLLGVPAYHSSELKSEVLRHHGQNNNLALTPLICLV